MNSQFIANITPAFQRYIEEVKLPESIFLDKGKPLPDNYGKDKLYLLVVHPELLFIYWEIGGEKKKELMEEFGESLTYEMNWVLKEKVGEREEEGRNISVILKSQNWFIKAEPDKIYMYELGFYTQKGKWRKVLSSNTIRTPRGKIASHYARGWEISKDRLKSLISESGDIVDQYFSRF